MLRVHWNCRNHVEQAHESLRKHTRISYHSHPQMVRLLFGFDADKKSVFPWWFAMNHAAEGAKTAAIIATIGRSDTSGNYHKKQTVQFQDEKAKQRQLVLDFILPYFASNDLIKPVTLPGRDWLFETALRIEHPYAHFVGVESSKTIFLQAARRIPGHAKSDYAIRVPSFGGGDYMYARRRRADKRPNSKITACNRLIRMDFSTFAGVLETDYGATYKERRKFNTKFYIRNCGWLDFTSGLCAETETSIRLMHWPIGDFKATKPVVITLMYGRDISGGAESRIRRVMKLQPRYTHKQHWVYLGKNGTPMLTLCGELQH